jgi:1,4-dihydroxy-2-naphthoyl-CoA hydrolase
MQLQFAFDTDTAWADQLARESVGLPKLLGMRTTVIEPGHTACALEVRPELVSSYGMIHGGVVSALVDHVLGSVCYPVIEHGSWSATTGYTLNFLAPVRSGTMVADATIVSMSARTAVVRIDVSNDGRPVALAQGSATLMPPKRTEPH